MKKFGLNRWGQIPLHPAEDPGRSGMYVRSGFVVAALLLMLLGALFLIFYH
jgi:hypothetical protein